MLAEVAPFVVPQFDALLVAFLILAGLIVAAGIIYVLHGFVRATVGGIAGLLGRIPGVGFIIASPVNAVYHWMNAEFAAAEAGLSKRIGSYFHQLAKLVKWVGDEIAAHASLLYLISTVMLGSTFTDLLRNLIALARSEIAAVRRQVHALTSSVVKPIQGELRALERWTYPRVRAVEHAIDVTIPRDVAGLRSRAKTIESELGKLWELMRKNEAALAATAFAGAVAVALSRLDLGWLRCSNTRSVGKSLCGVPAGQIDSLLGLLLGAAALADFRELVKLAQTVEHGVAAGLQDIAKL